ncbi:uncharacterized protein [Antennarius striatus]|uniref:uncharacterized protein isoform X2 n=1 Tax=Antennarius striatus TaxID=241820 RepID=UPI0035B07CA0
MGTRLRAALCALLLVNLGSATHDDGQTTASVTTQSGGSGTISEAPVTVFVPASGFNNTSQAVTSRSPNDPGTNSSSSVTVSLSNSSTTEETNTSVTLEADADNGTNIVTPSEADQLTSQSSTPGSHTPISHTSISSTTINLTHTAHTTPVDTPLATTPPTTTLHQSAFPLSETTMQSNQSITVSASKPAATTTSVVNRSSAASSTTSSQEPPSSASPSLRPSQNTLQTKKHPETFSAAQQTSTVTTPSSSSAQAKVHADTPSQLNVGGDTTIAHESPTLDPLLAGLVSAFIITAVIVTLLLFFKLRRRDNRPEFRRLQDLPMDDIMEDTPLSMYSY